MDYMQVFYTLLDMFKGVFTNWEFAVGLLMAISAIGVLGSMALVVGKVMLKL